MERPSAKCPEAASPPPGSRRWAALRFAASILASAAIALAVAALLPRRLTVATDIVGYPIHANYNCFANFNRYRLTVLLFPACAVLLYHLIGLRWPVSRWPKAIVHAPLAPAQVQGRLALLLQQVLRTLAVGLTLGLGYSMGDPPGRFWPDLAVVGAAYSAVPAGAALALTIRALSLERFVAISARVNALCAPFTLASVYAASQATQVFVVSDGSVHTYRWFPGWLAASAGAFIFAVTLARVLQARDLGTLRRIEAQGILLVAGPAVLLLYTASLPGPLNEVDLFHFGEFLAAASLFDGGAFPWRDCIFIHGLLQDVLAPLAGFKLFGDSIWGGWAGFSMVMTPLWWITHYFLFVYLFHSNPLLLFAAVMVPLLDAPVYVHWRFVPLPVVLLALAALLERSTRARAFALAVAVVAANVLTPELAYVVPACGAALLGYELSHYRRSLSPLANLARTIRATVAGLVVIGLWFAFLARHSAAGSFLHYYATFVPGHELTGAVPIARENLVQPVFILHMLLPPAMILLAIWYVVAAVRSRRQLDVRDWVMLSLTVIAFAYYTKFLSRPDMHVLQAAAPALPLLFYAIDKLLSLLAAALRRPAVVAWGGVGVLAIVLQLAPAGAIGGLARVRDHFSLRVEERPKFDRLGWSSPEAGQAGTWSDIDSFLRAYLEPDDTIFDFTDQPGLYHYLLRRKPASRYYHVSMAIRRKTQLDLIHDLERSLPKLVVFHSDGGLGDWDGVPRVVRHYEVSRFILQHYKPLARIHDQTFYARNDLALAARDGLPNGVEFLSAAEVNASAPECDWGDAPRFMPAEWLAPGPRLEPRETVQANQPFPKGAARQPDIVSTFALPEGVELAQAGGVEIDAETPANAMISISVVPLDRSEPRAESPPPKAIRPMSLRLPEAARGPIRVILDNCPQWYALEDRMLSLRQTPGLRVHGLRLLMRTDSSIR